MRSCLALCPLGLPRDPGCRWRALGAWLPRLRSAPSAPHPVSTPPSLLCQRLLDPPVPWRLFQGFLFWTYPFFPKAAGRILPALGLKPLFLPGMSELVPLPESARPFPPRVDARQPCLRLSPWWTGPPCAGLSDQWRREGGPRHRDPAHTAEHAATSLPASTTTTQP